MKATELLRLDHDKVRKIFQDFETASADRHEALFEEAAAELVVHSRVEEELFYPELRDRTETQDVVLESIEEHHVIEQLVDELRGMSPSDERFPAKFEVLRENVLHHAEEEEKELFPEAVRLLDASRLDALGQQIAARKAALEPRAKQEIKRRV